TPRSPCRQFYRSSMIRPCRVPSAVWGRKVWPIRFESKCAWTSPRLGSMIRPAPSMTPSRVDVPSFPAGSGTVPGAGETLPEAGEMAEKRPSEISTSTARASAVRGKRRTFLTIVMGPDYELSAVYHWRLCPPVAVPRERTVGPDRAPGDDRRLKGCAHDDFA